VVRGGKKKHWRIWFGINPIFFGAGTGGGKNYGGAKIPGLWPSRGKKKKLKKKKKNLRRYFWQGKKKTGLFFEARSSGGAPIFKGTIPTGGFRGGSFSRGFFFCFPWGPPPPKKFGLIKFPVAEKANKAGGGRVRRKKEPLFPGWEISRRVVGGGGPSPRGVFFFLVGRRCGGGNPGKKTTTGGGGGPECIGKNKKKNKLKGGTLVLFGAPNVAPPKRGAPIFKKNPGGRAFFWHVWSFRRAPRVGFPNLMMGNILRYFGRGPKKQLFSARTPEKLGKIFH